VKEAGVGIGWYGCNDGYGVTNRFIFLTESSIVADWNECLEVPLPFGVKAESEAKLRKACETIGVTWQEPKWYLTAYYG
jgi:hypothetical protein